MRSGINNVIILSKICQFRHVQKFIGSNPIIAIVPFILLFMWGSTFFKKLSSNEEKGGMLMVIILDSITNILSSYVADGIASALP